MWIISMIVLGFWTTIEIDNFDILANRIFVKMVRNKSFWNHQCDSLKTLMIYQIYLKNIWRLSIVSTHVSTQHSSFRIKTLHFGGYIINTKNQKFSFSFHFIYRAKRGTCLISNPFSNTPNHVPLRKRGLTCPREQLSSGNNFFKDKKTLFQGELKFFLFSFFHDGLHFMTRSCGYKRKKLLQHPFFKIF